MFYSCLCFNVSSSASRFTAVDLAEVPWRHYCKSLAVYSDWNVKGEWAVCPAKTRCVKPDGATKQPITHSAHPDNEPMKRTSPPRGERVSGVVVRRTSPTEAILDMDKARAESDRKDSRICEMSAFVFGRRCQLIMQSIFPAFQTIDLFSSPTPAPDTSGVSIRALQKLCKYCFKAAESVVQSYCTVVRSVTHSINTVIWYVVLERQLMPSLHVK